MGGSGLSLQREVIETARLSLDVVDRLLCFGHHFGGRFVTDEEIQVRFRFVEMADLNLRRLSKSSSRPRALPIIRESLSKNLARAFSVLATESAADSVSLETSVSSS